ncbi:ParA family protein, partial [Deinococcus wulumuqiensis]
MEVYEINPHLKILPGNIELFRVEMASGEGRENLLKRYVEVVKEDYDFILIDTPPTPSVWMTSALIASDYYLIPVKPDPISFTGIDLLKSVIDGRQETYGLRLKCLGVVLTIVEEGTINFSEARNKLAGDAVWGRYLFRSHLSKRVIISREQGNQKTILELDDLDAKASMAGIVRELLSRLT